jgi:regulator of protease activity HflC (stomatin/prohibitin superfamily)
MSMAINNTPFEVVPLDLPAPGVSERAADGLAGLPMLGVSVLLFIGATVLVIAGPMAAHGASAALVIAGVVLYVVGSVLTGGLTPVTPGEARVVQLFGRYTGTVRRTGLRWVNPATKRRKVSTRIRNHETAVAKVNDADGNPIEIAAVVVWQVEDTACAVYEVEDFVQFVGIQTETAVRHIATSYPYDARGGEGPSLRQNADEITAKLSVEIGARVRAA